MPVIIIDATLQEGLANSLGNTSVDLTIDDYRVNDYAGIIRRGKVYNLYEPCIGVNLYFTYVAPCRIGEVSRIVESRFFKARLLYVIRVIIRNLS